MKKFFALCMTAVMTLSMAVPAFALDHKVSYDATLGEMKAEYTIKNATKKSAPFHWDYFANPITNCYEGTLSTTVDVSGMLKNTLGKLEKQANGAYTIALDGIEVVNQGYMGLHITTKTDDAIADAYFASEEFKQNEYIPYYSSYMTLEEAVAALKADLYQNYDGTGIMEFHGYDDGSYLSFEKPGIYVIQSMVGYSAFEQDNLAATSILIIKDTPAPAPTPAPEAEKKAVPSASKVLVNGQQIAFDAYTIDGNNYFKLRDVAQVVNGTEKQFAVTWDGEKKAIDLVSNSPYTSTGSELAAGDGKAKSAVKNTSAIYKDGAKADMNAYTIGGNNYFKLRDLGQTFDFNVGWDAANKCISIDTTKGY